MTPPRTPHELFHALVALATCQVAPATCPLLSSFVSWRLISRSATSRVSAFPSAGAPNNELRRLGRLRRSADHPLPGVRAACSSSGSVGAQGGADRLSEHPALDRKHRQIGR